MTRCDKLRSVLKDNEGILISGFANIFYYTGFTSEDALVFITKTRQVLVTDSRYTVQARAQCPDFEIRDITEGVSKIASLLDCDILGFEENVVTVSELARFQKFGKKLVPMNDVISGPRQIKDEQEIRKIAAAEALCDKAFEDFLKNFRYGMTEREVALSLEFFMRKNGASGTAFDTIVASGKRSSMPHGVATDKVIGIGEFVTIDFGCRLDGYCSDMTRTIIYGKCSEKQREIYEIVLKAQKAAIAAIKPGALCRDIDAVARDIIKEAGYGDNFGHSLGHSVGIEIHEQPGFAPRSDAVVKKGNVITVEPGIYIEDFGGVRIEDLIYVDENTVNLTKTSKELTIL